MSALLSPEVVQWFVTHFGVTEEAAQGALTMFSQGDGQFPDALRAFSPDAFNEYMIAADAKRAMPVEEVAPVEAVAEEVAPVAEEAMPAAEEAPPVVEEAAPAVEEAAV